MDVEKSDNRHKDGKNRNKTAIQLIYGIALVLVGVGVFIRIPQVMPKIAEIEQFAPVMFFIRFCFYLMGILLIGGGSKKIYRYYDNETEK